jgi:hypothetical protein
VEAGLSGIGLSDRSGERPNPGPRRSSAIGQQRQPQYTLTLIGISRAPSTAARDTTASTSLRSLTVLNRLPEYASALSFARVVSAVSLGPSHAPGYEWV